MDDAVARLALTAANALFILCPFGDHSDASGHFCGARYTHYKKRLSFKVRTSVNSLLKRNKPGAIADETRYQRVGLTASANLRSARHWSVADLTTTVRSLCHRSRTLAHEIGMRTPVSRAIMGHRPGKNDHDECGGTPSLRFRSK